MKKLLNGFFMCQTMFCAIPFPSKVWDEDARGKMLLFLPVIGLEIGAVWAAVLGILRLFHIPTLAAAAVLCALPFILTGFIHLDGFMDVTDAVKSWRSLEKRREILKDSHVGSFAVIAVVLLMVLQFGFLGSVYEDIAPAILVFIPAVSRCCSGLWVSLLKPMSTSQYANSGGDKKACVPYLVMLVIFGAMAAIICGTSALSLVFCCVGHGLGVRRGYKSLEGMNGDISGYALTIGECCALAALCVIGG